MRAPEDLPRRPRKPGRGRRGRTVLIIAVVVAFVLLTSLRGIAGFYTDYLWYDSLGEGRVWRGILGAKASLALIFIALFFVLAWVNLLIADRIAPPYRLSGPEDELLERYHDLVADRTGWVRGVVAGLLAVIAGSGVSAEWNSWLLFVNGGSFGIKDDQFGRDVGFYVFRLPFLSFVVDWMFASLLIILIVVTVAHYLNGGIRVQPPSPRVTPQVKAHLSVLLAALAVVKAADYWLQRFELTTSSRGVVDGATYTDVNAQLPALNLLVLISLAAAVLFVANIFRRGWTLPVLAVGLWAFVAVAVGGIYPQMVQWLQVEPNESAKEEPYIERNIEATRYALGLQKVRTERFTPTTDPAQVDLAGSAATIRNIRLWDPSASLSGQTFEQLQRIRDYYNINDIDVDRYQIDGQATQVNVGARTINPDGIPGDSWENKHLAYTHGNGIVLAPSNASQGTEPEFLIGNVPPTVDPRLTESGITLDQPGVYFGEGLGGYVVVDTRRSEIDYQQDNETQTTTYSGADGVEAGSLLRRAAFALRFGDLSPLISDFMTDKSRIIYVRDVIDRVHALAPFLHADADPYPIMVDGRVLWMVDLYTTTSRFPYGQGAETDQLPEGSGLRHDFNYVRNSVKATVDAYDGTVSLYVVDDNDPIIKAYEKSFPGLFTDGDDMPEDVRAHMRYPEDVFRVQTTAYGRYHLTNASSFFTQEDGWRVARDPGTSGADPSTPVTDTQGQATGEQRAPRITPYYQLLQLPNSQPTDGEATTAAGDATTAEGEAAAAGQEPAGEGAAGQEPAGQAEMVLMRPFVPFSEGDKNQLLTAFMAARMDGDHYGELVVYQMPSELPDGPGLAAASIAADEQVASVETLLGSTGSLVRKGNLLLVPIDNALVYVQPFYVVGDNQDRQLPRLERVVVVFGNDVATADTLAEALRELFGQDVATQENREEDTTPLPTAPDENVGPGDENNGGTAAEQAERLLDQAVDAFGEAEAALREGDIGTYQDKVDEARSKVEAANAILTDGSSTTSTTTPSTPTTAPSG
jgi:uncharacterized protein